ncbi:putative mitochondrial hypothetical protein [Leptomonas pyrrhocoris]|uniref:Uncharacterized protein n=1 Tax=Leptomonas pyrrhocoris TaxID=157538 RepID=A0A0M9FPB7_LEPPY|nr:putative mitochondrial hypothetical protein [Leptomonas pyrrhocoris]KPA73330.1 putative mitochondrial hypothetical protein [Leptomonas pyrrhocoris]|eukprot:XP_015651769.1 putative mitochondrial hypothetical protein [Leptomonas pyrrhocoris]
MLRRSLRVLAVGIPRSAWDPAHHHENWVDSYSTSIADRRHWPAKKWSIGLEPRTPREWLRYSYRNLAYAYNGALRACTTFPEMLVYYKEMKQRGVKVDVDTLNVLLSRAARYEHIHIDDVFLLFDELTALGARPDVASVETLHTVLEHAAHQPPEWREARRRQLVELYQYLALEEIERLAPHHADALLAVQIARLRGNLKQLRASLSPAVYRRYFAIVDCGETLIQEVHNFLWEYVGSDHAALDVPSLRLRIPFVASVMKRPAATADPATVKSTDFEDADVCSVLLAAVERCVDGDFHDRRPVSERRMYLALLTMLTSSGVLYSADLMAQLMDIVKYTRDERARDRDAQRLLRYALRGSSAANDVAHRELWKAVAPPVDARVVGRYLASRDPWSPLHICYDRSLQFGAFPVLLPSAQSSVASPAATASSDAEVPSSHAAQPSTAGAAVEEGAEGVSADLLPSTTPEPVAEGGARPSSEGNTGEEKSSSSSSSNAVTPRTAEALQQRWHDVQRLIDVTGVLKRLQQPQQHSSGSNCSHAPTQADAQNAMEVFTGCAVFLRGIASNERYGSVEEAMSIQAVGEASGHVAGGASVPYAAVLDFDVWHRLLQCVQQLRHDTEKFIAQQYELHGWQVEPEFECWEAMLVVLRCVLDFCVVHTQQYGRAAGGGMAETLFQESAQLRAELVEESRARFNGRMRILWLQEV